MVIDNTAPTAEQARNWQQLFDILFTPSTARAGDTPERDADNERFPTTDIPTNVVGNFYFNSRARMRAVSLEELIAILE